MQSQSAKMQPVCPTCGQTRHLCACDSGATVALSDAGAPLSFAPQSLPMPQLSGASATQTGSVLGERYILVEELGRGGMGTVFKARHISLPKHFAVKLLKAELSKDRDFRARFDQEAKTASFLNHPNLVSIIDHGTSNLGEAYLVMDFIEGSSLDSTLEAVKRLDQRRAVKIFQQICDGLIHAHGLGIIHRDLKPSNIMLINNKQTKDFVKIVDFGIAKMISGDGNITQSLTKTGEFFGSPLYMSPEQGNGVKPDQRTDIYSLGVLMYECLTAAPPFRGENFFFTMVLHNEAQPKPFDPALAISPGLEAIVMKSLEKNPDDRFQSMEELHKALDNVFREEKAEPVSGKGPTTKKRFVYASAFALVCAGLTGLAFVTQHQHQPTKSTVPAQASTTIKTTGSPDREPNIMDIVPETREEKEAEALPAIPDSIQIAPADQNLSAKQLAARGLALKPADGDHLSLLPARYITTAIEKSPDTYSFYEDLAGIYWWQQEKCPDNMRQSCKEKCLAVYNVAIKRFPKAGELYHARANVLNSLGQKDKALADSETALRLDPQNNEAHLAHGAFLAALGRYKEALEEFEKHIDSRHKNYFYTMGSCYQNLQQYEKTIQFADKWLAVVGPREELVLLKADAEEALHQDVRALADYEKLVRLWPQEQGNRAQNIEHLKNSLQTGLPAIPATVKLQGGDQSLSPQALTDKGMALAAKNRSDWQDLLPAKYFSEAIALDPQFAYAYGSLGGFYWDQSRKAPAKNGPELMQKSLQVYSEEIKHLPRNTDGYFGRSNIYAAMHDYAKALADCDQAIHLAPNDKVLRLKRANLLHITHATSEAIREYEKYIGPNDLILISDLGHCYQEQNHHQKTITFASHWLKQLGPQPQLIVLRADSEKASGQYKAALVDYQSYVKMRPEEKEPLASTIARCKEAVANGH